MTYKKTFNIKRWNDWDDIVNDSIRIFFETYSVLPNILIANSHTLTQFEFITTISPKRKNAITDEGKLPENDEEIRLNSFQNRMWDIDFAVDAKIKDKYFVLMYESDPQWEGDKIHMPTPEKKSDKVTA